MKRFISVIMAFVILPFLFLSCSNDEDNTQQNDNSSQNNENVELLALDISSETEADAIFICKDGSYALYDEETASGVGVIQFNSSYKNDFYDGMTVLLDENKNPLIASVGGFHIIFNNFRLDKFNCAVINPNGSIDYYWDLEMDTSVFTDDNPYKVKGITRVSDVTKAKLFYGLKVISFAATALLTVTACSTAIVYGAPIVAAAVVGVGILSIAHSIYSEGVESGLWNNKIKYAEFPLNVTEKTFDFLDVDKSTGYFKISSEGFVLGVAADLLNDLGTRGLESIGNYEEEVNNIFENEEWQIKLSTYLLECSVKESTYTVDVSTLAAWEIDDSNIDKSWCNVYKENERIVVKVKEYDGIEDRICFAKVKTLARETDDIPPATLTIKQSGVLFELSARELVFTQEGGTQGVNVNTNNTVTSWKVTSRPEWCTTEKKWDIGLFVTVKEDKHLLEDREGTITATAQLTDGTSINRYLIIKQIVQDTWNGTKWQFTGNVNASGNASIIGNINMSEVTNFGVDIRDVDRNDFSLSGDLAGLESKSRISCDADNNLILSYSETMSESGVSMNIYTKITFTRTSTTTATGIMSCSAITNIPGYGGYTTISMNGNFNGNLIQ